MKKLLMSTAGVVLTIAICMGLAGCSGNGALAEATVVDDRLRGDDVSAFHHGRGFSLFGQGRPASAFVDFDGCAPVIGTL